MGRDADDPAHSHHGARLRSMQDLWTQKSPINSKHIFHFVFRKKSFKIPQPKKKLSHHRFFTKFDPKKLSHHRFLTKFDPKIIVPSSIFHQIRPKKNCPITDLLLNRTQKKIVPSPISYQNRWDNCFWVEVLLKYFFHLIPLSCFFSVI